MSATLEARLAAVKLRCEEAHQGHLLHFWPALDDLRRGELLDDLERIDFAAVPRLVADYVRKSPDHAAFSKLEPAPYVPRVNPAALDATARDAIDRGRSLIAAGRVAALMVAGGQGTRLGYDGPKGCLPVSPVRNKSLFQLFAEQIVAAGRKAGRPIHWYILTSPANDTATRAFFAEHLYFGLSPDGVTFFEQGVMPAFDPQGRILLDLPHRVALAPDGHGGVLLAMRQRGILADMARRGIDLLSYFQVDNPLVPCVDPLFVGLHDRAGSEMSTKVCPKADDRERVGNVLLADGKLCVIEYSDLPDALATARNADGSRRFNAANLAIHVISRGFIERLTADPARFALPWHRAHKKVPHVDPATGKRVEPAEPNAIKLEAFIFDALPLAAGKPLVLEIDRAEEFSPVKNASGSDSLATAQRDMVRRAARWLESAGVDVPRGGDDEPAVPIEISPLRANCSADLKGIARLSFGSPLYVE